MGGEIIVRPTNGLCNRLGVVTSFAVLARRCNRELKVCWGPGHGWSNEDLDDLFEPRFPRVGMAEFERILPDALCVHETATVSGVGGLSEVWSSASGAVLAAAFDELTHPVVAYHGFRRCQDLLAPEERRRLLPGFERDYVAGLRAWRPVRAIRERVGAIADEFDRHTVGVHIRRGDAVNHPVLAAEFGRSSDAAFMARMDRILRYRPASSFFLATDCESTQQRFHDRYPGRILVNSDKQFVPSVYARPKDNQHDAVVDLFALAQTGRILGSYYSTFSHTAAMLGGVRLSVVIGDSSLARLRRVAAYCRHEIVRRRSRHAG